MLVQINTMPNEIYCLLEGEVLLHSQFRELTKKPGAHLAKTEPGSRVQKQQLEGNLGMPSGSLIGSMEQMTPIGLECPILMMKSPYTYVAKTPIVVLSISL